MGFLLTASAKHAGSITSMPLPKGKSACGQHAAGARLEPKRFALRLHAAQLPMEYPVQPKLRIGEPKDKFEQEADRIADRVMTMPEALPHRIVRSTLGSETTTHLVQREPGDGHNPNDKTPPKEEYNKAELEFHSALHFNRTFSGFNPTSEPKEGEYSIIWWSVWNTGWKTAPEHTNRLTIYNADLCSGCRYEKDEIFRSEIRAPSIVASNQPGKSDYENAVLIGMPLSAGHYEAYVELDVHNEVEEINEDNNTAFMVFVVRAGGQAGSAVEEAEGTIQKKQDAGPTPDVEPNLESPIGLLRGGGRPLPLPLRDFFEPRLGYDLSQVRIHSDACAAEEARSLRAKAFTTGGDIVFGEGEYAPEKPAGRRLLAHELTHVIQQTGSSHPVVQRKPDDTCPKLISFTASGKDPALTDKCRGGKCRFGLGCCETKRGECGSGDASGMVFKAVVKAGKNCKGQLAFMQNLLSSDRKVTMSDGTGECLKINKPHRDGGIPWKGCEVSVDVPGEFTIISDDCPHRMLTDNPTEVSITDSFKTFLLWKAEGEKDRHPIANLTWGWSGKITKAKGKECGSQYKIVSASHTDGEGNASMDKPVTTPEVKDVKPGPCK